MRKIVISTLLAGAAFAVQPAHASLVLAGRDCAASDIGVSGGAGFACSGFFEGNLVNAANKTEQDQALAMIGFAGSDAWLNQVELISKLGSPIVDFSHLLSGTTYIAMHFGNVPNPSGGKLNNVTAFYKFDAGTSMDSFKSAFKSASNAILYSTGGAVPEPATWAMMILGMGAVGAALRRRKTRVSYSMA
ncbi:MAG: PEP-CTERM sorting domain-containing protein [Sphingomonadales bacterium]|nr:MAG: PEP-CTERM sorting domain-containing protein [Sphingomonadales bacterium]TNF03135.1 MAG: PEP-CTERM sorting domain-containing protein [Sphingomonadales bacterium]